MAGDWIKMRCDLGEDPAVIAIAGATGLDEDSVVGKLHKIWSWADQHTTDGHARTVTNVTAERWLDRYVRTDGFARAMIEAGWLVIDSNGIQFPNFDRHNTQSGKERALAAKRSAKYRAGNHGSTVTPTVTGPSATPSPTEDYTEDIKRPAKPKGAGVFSKLEEADLRDPERVIRWFEFASSQPKPVIQDSEANRINVLCAAERALQVGDNPVALFSNLVAKAAWHFATQEQEDRAMAKLRELRSSRPPPDDRPATIELTLKTP